MSDSRTYHYLLQREDGRWAIAFGDFSKADVQQEARDNRDSGSNFDARGKAIVRARDQRVVSVKYAGAERAVAAIVTEMNAT